MRLTNLTVHFSSDWQPDNYYQSLYPLPSSITHLTLRSYGHRRRLREKPHGLLSASMNSLVDEIINNLPPLLRNLTVNIGYVGPVVNNLPPCLTHLSVPFEFNDQVDNLPASLTHLILRTDVFNQSIDHLPLHLTHLEIYSWMFAESLDHLPSNLAHLALYYFASVSVDHLPQSLKYLELCIECMVDHLPHQLQILKLLHWRLLYPIDHLPSSLTHLSVNCDSFTRPIDWLPPHLKYLHLSSKLFSHPLDNLPSTLTYFAFDCPHFNQFSPQFMDHLPTSLNSLVCTFNDRTKKLHHPPSSLVHITFIVDNIQQLKDLPSVSSLIVKNCFSEEWALKIQYYPPFSGKKK